MFSAEWHACNDALIGKKHLIVLTDLDGKKKKNADDRMARVTQTTGCWFLGKWLRRLEVRRQMATWCTDSPMRLHTQQEIHLWDGSLSVMPQIWVWWRTQEPRASNGDFQPSLKGFLRAQMCRALNLIQLCLSLQGLLKGRLIRLYSRLYREFHTQQICAQWLYCVSASAAWKQALKTHKYSLHQPENCLNIRMPTS